MLKKYYPCGEFPKYALLIQIRWDRGVILIFNSYLCAVLTNNEQYKKSNNNANMEQPFNLVSNTTLKKNVADYTLIVIGAFLQALSYSLFLAPYKIVPGGVYGISIVLHHVTQGLFSFMNVRKLPINKFDV